AAGRGGADLLPLRRRGGPDVVEAGAGLRDRVLARPEALRQPPEPVPHRNRGRRLLAAGRAGGRVRQGDGRAERLVERSTGMDTLVVEVEVSHVIEVWSRAQGRKS